MSKKQGKGTFRHTKKNVLHKKRGLRGGIKFGSSSPSPSPVKRASANIDQDGTLHGMRGKFIFTPLSENQCQDYMAEINIYENNNQKSINLVPNSGGIRDYNECLKKLNRVVTFDTSLTTGIPRITKDTKTLTLRGCKAIKKGIIGTTDQFKYEIFSPAATTEPPNGGTQSETLVGTFTQLPISELVKMAGQSEKYNILCSSQSYGELSSKPSALGPEDYLSDYLSCLENVASKFGSDSDPYGSQSGNFLPQESSILRKFGKSDQCRIVLVAGNIGTEIQNPDNDGAIFSLASQENAAEYPSPKPVTDLNKYKEDNTAGPLAQLSCHPVVAEFILQHAARDLPQRKIGTLQYLFDSDFLVINAVSDVIANITPHESEQKKAGLSLNNGYLEVKGSNDEGDFRSTNFKFGSNIDSAGRKKLENLGYTIFDSFRKNLRVLQTDDVPTSGLRPPPESKQDAAGYKEFNSDATSKVSLIYSSAVPLNYVYYLKPEEIDPINPQRVDINQLKVAINREKSLLQYGVAGFNLVAQYFGAMVSAYNKRKKMQTRVKLFLTPLGGGVFKNPREMIACSALLAYYQAQQLFTDFDKSVEVIFLVFDRNEAECKDFIEFFNNGGFHPKDVPPNQFKSDGDDGDETDVGLPSKLKSQVVGDDVGVDVGDGVGGSKSRRRHRRHAHKTRRGRKSKSKSKPHKRQRNMRKRTRKHKKYTRKR